MAYPSAARQLPIGAARRITLGFLSSWHIYEGTTIDPYANVMLRGIQAGARDCGCNLLLACGVGPLPGIQDSAPAWPVAAPGAALVPVGPWNADGLIVAPPRLSSEQARYLRDLRAEGYPVVFSTTDEPGPAVATDNRGGVLQAIQHLLGHGHRRVAFIAGLDKPSGDSAERLLAYHEALAALRLGAPLLAYGEGTTLGGYRAAQALLARGEPFSAILAHNDRSALGAIRALQDAGLRVPADVAVIGFDNILEAGAETPTLTTIQNPAFMLGYELVRSVLGLIAGDPQAGAVVRVPTHMVLRRSCGCHPDDQAAATLARLVPQPAPSEPGLIQAMAQSTLATLQHFATDEIIAICGDLLRAYISSLCDSQAHAWQRAVDELLRRTAALGDSALAWQRALIVLHHALPQILDQLPQPADPRYALTLLDSARLAISEQAEMHATRVLFRYMDRSERVGLMTAQLLAALDERQIAQILEENLPSLHIRRLLVALFVPEEDDPTAQSAARFCIGAAQPPGPQPFVTRQFPPPGLCPDAEPFQLTLLPLTLHEQISGFVAFDGENIELYAAIVRNLAAALRSSQLYRAAIEGRWLAEEANRLKSRFLSTVSHELRTPLNLIVGLSEMLLHLNQSQPSPGQIDHLWQDIERIYTTSQHLGHLINDVLDLASSEAGQLRLTYEPLDLVEVMRPVLATGRQMAREKGLAWHAAVPAQPLWVLGDQTRLRQVALNLLSNAVKFTASGAIRFEIAARDAEALVSVSDTGIGIAPAEQAAIFEEFQRSEQAVARGYSGLGLGLAIARQLVAQHKGQISVRSSGREGQGATFSFALPLIPAQPPAEPAPPTVAPPTVALLLSREAQIDRALDAALQQRGFQALAIRLADDPAWLSRLLAQPPHALIVDVLLLAQQGWGLIDRCTQHAALRDVPVLLCALDAEQSRGGVLDLNHMVKPLSAEQLLDTLSRLGLGDSPPARPQSILLVDDDAGALHLNAQLVREYLPGCQIRQARNGREALAAIAQQRPDLVLLDLMMPELDGFGVLDALRAQPELCDIPVVVLSSKMLTDADVARLGHSVTAMLSKGLFNSAEILAHLEKALARRRVQSHPIQLLVQRVLAFIHTNYSEPLTRDQMAQFVGVSAGYLTECFHKEMGIAPMTYLTRYRINQARLLLETTDRNIADIAVAVGFADGAHLSRLFQRELKVSPRAYRRGLRPER